MADESHVLELLPDFVLGQLDDGELVEVAAHLQGCGRCQSALDDYHDMLEALPLAVPQREPPQGLEEKVLLAVEKARASGLEPKPAPARPRRLLLDWLRSPAWALVSLVLLGLLAAFNLYLWDQLRQPPLPTTLETVALQGTDYYPEATGIMIVGGDGSVGTLVVDKLDMLQPSQEYQLWLVLDGEFEDGGMIRIDEDGYGVKYIHADRPLLSYTSFDITIEPEGGNLVPTGNVVLHVDL